MEEAPKIPNWIKILNELQERAKKFVSDHESMPLPSSRNKQKCHRDGC